jgi:hypothetical protein
MDSRFAIVPYLFLIVLPSQKASAADFPLQLSGTWEAKKFPEPTITDGIKTYVVKDELFFQSEGYTYTYVVGFDIGETACDSRLDYEWKLAGMEGDAYVLSFKHGVETLSCNDGTEDIVTDIPEGSRPDLILAIKFVTRDEVRISSGGQAKSFIRKKSD